MLPLEWIAQFSLVAAAIVFIGFATVLVYWKQRYPRGPSWLASLRATLVDFEDILEYRKNWKLQFGRVYAIFNGRNPRVFMTDYDVIYDAFVRQSDACSSRPKGSGIHLSSNFDKGIIASPHWKEQRRFALSVLREQGMGKIDMEHKIMEEVGPFLKKLEEHGGDRIDVDSYMRRAVSNVICNLVLGFRFDYDDPALASLLSNFEFQMTLKRKMNLIAATMLQYLPGDIFGYQKYLASARTSAEYFIDAIRQHKDKLDPDNPRDFIDAYLIQMKTVEKQWEYSSFDEMNCVASVMELFVAGTDTTANTLMWAWLFMMLHPKIQQRVQTEIDQCLGLQAPSLKDRARMPYVEAALTEVLRLANTASASLQHKVDNEMTLAGVTIPKDAVLHASLYEVHMEESNYSRPEQFNPSRFLNSDGTFEKPKKFIPFGIGKRACLGESLARAELFLFFTSVMQRFIIETPSGCHFTTEGKVGLVHHPLPYTAIFKQRHGS